MKAIFEGSTYVPAIRGFYFEADGLTEKLARSMRPRFRLPGTAVPPAIRSAAIFGTSFTKVTFEFLGGQKLTLHDVTLADCRPAGDDYELGFVFHTITCE